MKTLLSVREEIKLFLPVIIYTNQTFDDFTNTFFSDCFAEIQVLVEESTILSNFIVEFKY
jgi:hypothetical protein